MWNMSEMSSWPVSEASLCESRRTLNQTLSMIGDLWRISAGIQRSSQGVHGFESQGVRMMIEITNVQLRNGEIIA
jgi:hypothetical protein